MCIRDRYKIVNTGAFVYNPSRLNLGSIAYRTGGLCIVSHLYIVFYLNEEGKKRIDPDWLFMYFRRNEFYREVTFRNFGSQRPEFNFNDMSDIMIPLPDIAVQQKYVAIYKAMVTNQQSYERGLEDLKLTFDALVDNLKNTATRKPVRDLLVEVDNRNSDGEIVDVPVSYTHLDVYKRQPLVLPSIPRSLLYPWYLPWPLPCLYGSPSLAKRNGNPILKALSGGDFPAA